MRYLLPPAVLLFAALGATLLWVYRPQPVEESPARVLPVVEAVEVRPGPVQLFVATQGTVSPHRRTVVSAEVAGRIVAVSPQLKSGGYFPAGAVMVEIDRADYKSALAAARAEQARAALRLAQEEAQAAQAWEEWAKMGEGDPPDLAVRRPQLAEARALAAAAEAALTKSQRDLERTRVTAPFAGLVEEKLADLGQFVGPGGVSPIARLISVDFAEIRLPLAADEVALIDLPGLPPGAGGAGERSGSAPLPAPGPRVFFTPRADDKSTAWEGVIDRMESAVDPDTRIAYAVARVTDPYNLAGEPGRPQLRVGHFVSAEIFGHRLPVAVALPRRALYAASVVLVVDGEDRLRRRPVEVAQAGSERAVVVGGLTAGERVCLSPPESFVEGMQVEPREPPAPPLP